MNEVVVLLGSNLGDGYALFQQATDLLEKEVGKRIMHSSIYKSPPWGFEHDNDFLNQVLVLETNYDPEKVLIICLSIEEKMGRVRSSKKEYEPRTIDIDLLFMEDKILAAKDLSLPHPRLHLRKFVLLPLVELMPDFIHPTLHKSVQELLTLCKDKSEVLKQ